VLLANSNSSALTNKKRRYTIGTQSSRELLGRILDMWATRAPAAAASGSPWECPDMDLSDSWGIVSSKESTSWIVSGRNAAGTPAASVSELLIAGRAGMRIGNAQTLKQRAQEGGVWPSERVHKLVPSDDPRSTGAALSRCSDRIMATIDASSVAKEIVDDLFPVAQGIHESAPMSFCLR
jgi:hypothetical protein